MRVTPPRRHRAAFWTSVLAAVVVTVAGTSYAVAGAKDDPGPAATVPPQRNTPRIAAT